MSNGAIVRKGVVSVIMRGEKLQTYDTIEYKWKMNCKLKCEDPKMYFRPDPRQYSAINLGTWAIGHNM